MGYKQGADELRIRATLIKQGVGPDADPTPAIPPRPSVPPKPTGRPRDWLDNFLDDNAAPAAEDQDDEPEEEPEESGPAPTPGTPKTAAAKTKRQIKPRKRKKPKRRKRPGPNTPHTPWDSRPQDPRQSLIDAYDRIPYRLKWLGYHATAAYLGWTCGLVDYATGVTAWTADGRTEDWQAWFFYALGAATFLLYRRTRGQWWPVAWCAAVPVASTVVGVLLYAPTP